MTEHPHRSTVWELLQQRPLLILLALAVPVVEYLASQSGAPGPSTAVVRNPFAAIAAASVFCRYVLCAPRGPSRRWIVYLSPLAVAIGMSSAPHAAPIQIRMMNMLFAIGVLGAFGFILSAVRTRDRQERAKYAGQLMDALLLPVSASMVSFGLWSTAQVNPVYDARVYAFEEILGARFSLLGVWSYHLFRPLSAVATACYGTVALGIVLVAAAQRTARREGDVLAATVVAGACGFALYFACPVVGPLQVFGPIYPNALPPVPAGVPLMSAAIGFPRNGMPSLHTVWALLIWFNAQTLPNAYRRAVRLFVVMNLWAAMGLDDTHWFMDVVVGVPLAVAVQSAVVRDEHDGRRWADAMACAALTAIWLIGFRTADPLLRMPTAVAWLGVVATVWWPLSRQRTAFEADSTRRAVPLVRAILAADSEQVDRRFQKVVES
jgi:hypothetical protein